MPLPLPAFYSSQKDLYDSIQAHAFKHHYAFSIGRSRKINSSSRRMVEYYCDRYGKPPVRNRSESPRNRSESPRNRSEIFRDHTEGPLRRRKRCTSSRKTGCTFSVNAWELLDGRWELRHKPEAKYSCHNHPPSQSPSSHPSHRRIPTETRLQLENLRETISR